MKTYNQMAEDVFIRRDKYEAEKRKKKKTAERTAVSISCCIVAVMCVAVWKNNSLKQLDTANGVSTTEKTPPQKEPDAAVVDKEETTVFQGAIPANPDVTKNTEKNNDAHTVKTTFAIVTEPNSNQNDGDRLFCYLNEITGSVAGHPIYRDPELHYTEEYSDTESAEYYGIKLYRLVALVPNDMKLCQGSHKKIFTNGGTLVEERSEFVFKGDDSRDVCIQANRLGPVSDCIYMSDTDLITTFMTEKNGKVDVKVYSEKYEDESETFFVADFSVDGVNYRVTAKNITIKELQPILCELIAF